MVAFMKSLEEIVEKMKDRNVSKVAKAIGMHRQQLYRITTGKNKNPRLLTIEKLSKYLEENA